VRKTSARIGGDRHRSSYEDGADPESTQAIVVDSRPKVEAITDNLLAASTSIRSQ